MANKVKFISLRSLLIIFLVMLIFCIYEIYRLNNATSINSDFTIEVVNLGGKKISVDSVISLTGLSSKKSGYICIADGEKYHDPIFNSLTKTIVLDEMKNFCSISKSDYNIINNISDDNVYEYYFNNKCDLEKIYKFENYVGFDSNPKSICWRVGQANEANGNHL